MAADYKKLKEGIASAIKSNGAGEITGDILQEQMLNVVDTLDEGKAEAADLADIKANVAKLKVMVESGAGGGGEGGGGLIIVDDREILDALEVPQGTIASVVTETDNETEKPLAELYDFIAEGGNPQGEVDYDILPRMTDVALTFPNLPTWPDGRILIGREGGVTSSRYYLVVDSTRVRFAYGQGEILLLAENNGETIAVYDDAVAQMHEILRGVDGLRYMGIAAGSIEDLSQFFAIIQREVIADAYILGETWKRLMKDGEMPEIDLSALAQKTDLDALTEAVVENEEVTAAALNDLNDRKASKEDVANAIAEATENIGGGTIPIMMHTEASFSITPNVYHKWGEVASLTISLEPPTDDSIVNEYIIEFTAGANAPTIALPDNLLFAGALEIEANATYQISIINGLVVWSAFKDE